MVTCCFILASVSLCKQNTFVLFVRLLIWFQHIGVEHIATLICLLPQYQSLPIVSVSALKIECCGIMVNNPASYLRGHGLNLISVANDLT